MKTVEVTPYCEVDGIRLFKDSQILALIDRAEKDGSLPAIFYGNERYKGQDFLDRVKHAEDVELHIVKHGEDTVGFVWIDQIQQKRGFAHYCVFQDYWGDPDLEGMVAQVVEVLLERFGVLIGVTQAWNTHAINFRKKIGAVLVGEIPKYFYDPTSDRYESGMMYYITKENINGRE